MMEILVEIRRVEHFNKYIRKHVNIDERVFYLTKTLYLCCLPMCVSSELLSNTE